MYVTEDSSTKQETNAMLGKNILSYKEMTEIKKGKWGKGYK